MFLYSNFRDRLSQQQWIANIEMYYLFNKIKIQNINIQIIQIQKDTYSILPPSTTALSFNI